MMFLTISNMSPHGENVCALKQDRYIDETLREIFIDRSYLRGRQIFS